jgi:hypothetical protein
MAQLALGVVGAAIGTFFGAPEVGWMVGVAIGAVLFPEHPKRPSPNDVRVQQSAYGQYIPRVYGMYRVAGNVIWAGQPVEHDPSGKGGGKGSGQPTVSMSFAVALCEGPISGVRRIWANGKLVYDVSNPSNFQQISGSAAMLSNFQVYLGDENQMPDPTMESVLGVGNVPAHRGLAYVVFNNLDLSQWGNYLPSFTFEVITNAQQVYSYQQVAVTDSTSNYDGTITGLSAQGGLFMSFNGGPGLSNTNYQGVGVWQLTPYGVYAQNPYGPAQTVFPPDVPAITGGAAPYDFDAPGFVAFNNTYGTYCFYGADGLSELICAPGLATGVFGTQHSMIKRGMVMYNACNYGNGNFPLQKCSLVGASGNPLQTGTMMATSTVQKPFQLIGVTGAYVYAIDSSKILYQFDQGTLALVNSWNLAALGLFNAGDAGYAVDDRHVYIGGTNLYCFDTVSGALTGLVTNGIIPGQMQTMKVINPGFIVFGYLQGSSADRAAIGFLTLGFNLAMSPVTLSSIVADICTRAGLQPSQYDVSQLTDLVTGYALTQHGSPREQISPLMEAYFFDVSDTDGLLKFIKRGSSPVATFQWGALGAGTRQTEEAVENPIIETIQQEMDLPATVTMSYVGQGNDYQPVTQRAFSTTTASNKDFASQFPLVLSDDQGLQKAQTTLWAAWMARRAYEFKTDVSYMQYEPTDVVNLQTQAGQLLPVRLVSCQYDGMGVLSWKAVSEYPAMYNSTAVGGPTSGAGTGFQTQSIGYSGPTVLAVLDVPPLRDSDIAPGLYIAACGYATNWPGANVEISRDGNSYTQLKTVTAASPIGYTKGALPNFTGGNQPDELSTVTVVLYSGQLASVSYANFLAGLSAAYIGGEIIYFRNAVLVAANTYQLSGLLRARGGTEKFMAGHQAGERFVFLDATKLTTVGLNTSDIGTKLYFEAYTLNQLGTVTPSGQQTLTPVNGRIKELSPWLLAAGKGSAASVNDISLQWLRRARVNSQWYSGTDVPLDESSESYVVNISDNAGNIKRTVTVLGPFVSPAVPSLVYTNAQIVADGFIGGNTINFSVYQNTDQGVQGVAATTSIVR